MALSLRNYTISRVVQGTHHQCDVRYGTSSGIQCSCMSPISVSWTLFKSPGLWDKFDLGCIVSKGDQLFKFVGKFRYLGIKDLKQELLIENSSINKEILKKRQKKLELGYICYLLKKL